MQSDKLFDYRHTRSYEVRGVLEALIQLRNRVHHFSGAFYHGDLRDIEQHLITVHRLAVLLYDEESAATARGLRDRLCREAEEVAQEIERIGLLTALPFCADHPWKPHHIVVFRHILTWGHHEDGEHLFGNRPYPPGTLQGAIDFGNRGLDMSWDCMPDAEESMAKVQNLENSHCRSA